jgi:DUF4097 and DUF4098 domain-containing protein YvlB
MISKAGVPRVGLRVLFGLLILGITWLPVGAQDSRQSFRVTPQLSELEVSSKSGSIKVVAGDGNTITVKVREKDGGVKVNEFQPKPSQVKIEVIGSGSVKLEISVPATSNLDLFCYKCEIKVKNISGPVVAKTASGDIEIEGSRSALVEAYTTTGNLFFDGEILPSGSYTLKSLSGGVNLVLPAAADVKLSATSFRGGIGLGNFQWKFAKQTDQFVEATCGQGRAAVHLLTKEGTIQIHRKM